jgi:DNA mismatch repair protein MutL
LKNEEKVFGAVKEAVKRGLEEVNLIRDVEIEFETSAKATKNYEFSRHRQENLFENKYDASLVSGETGDALMGRVAGGNLDNYELELGDRKVLEEPEVKNLFKDFNILGQVNKTYIICENPDGMVIIDQHAAQERVNYEKFLKQYMNLTVRRQTLLQPRVIELTPGQKQAAIVNYDFFVKLGYDFADFGENTIKLSMVPESFANLKSILFIDIINELINLKSESVDTTIEEKIIRMSCRASVKAGDELTMSEIRKLLTDLGKCGNPYSCPHGRPTIISLSIADLEKKFKRTGW